jgi:hypothetical protein
VRTEPALHDHRWWENRLFPVSWCLVVVGITVLNTWAAFSEKGSLGTFVSDDDDAERHRPQPFLRAGRP